MSGLLARAGGIEPPFAGLHARPSSPSRPPGVYNPHIGRESPPTFYAVILGTLNCLRTYSL